jgi:hypothetical protein
MSTVSVFFKRRLGRGTAARQLPPLGTPMSDAGFYLFLLYFMMLSKFRPSGFESNHRTIGESRTD